jgi:hypothetical protein
LGGVGTLFQKGSDPPEATLNGGFRNTPWLDFLVNWYYYLGMRNDQYLKNAKQVPLLRQGFIAFLLILLFTSPLFLQAEREESLAYQWEFSLGGVSYYVSEANYWNFGPELTIHYAISNTFFGLYVSASYPTVKMSSRGYGFEGGVPMDGGIWLSSRSETSPFKLGAGLSHIFGSDSDGSQIKGFGAHISVQASYWFERHLGVWARGVLRLWFAERRYDSKTSPSFSAGVGFRF